ncbi:MAG: hypothetical protein K8L97_14920 [Anaerolineae bacterium]|nr:hypothetical protein [Anaerolineae bacterium]
MSASKYRYTQEKWNEIKEEIRAILIEKAKERGMITYSDLVSELETVSFEPNSLALFSLLGEISTDEDKLNRGMLSVIVVHKAGDMQPGKGFFELAKSLNRDTGDILKCWVDEFKKVHAYWSNLD